MASGNHMPAQQQQCLRRNEEHSTRIEGFTQTNPGTPLFTRMYEKKNESEQQEYKEV